MFGFRHQRLDVHFFFFFKFLIVLFKVILEARSKGDRSENMLSQGLHHPFKRSHAWSRASTKWGWMSFNKLKPSLKGIQQKVHLGSLLLNGLRGHD